MRCSAPVPTRASFGGEALPRNTGEPDPRGAQALADGEFHRRHHGGHVPWGIGGTTSSYGGSVGYSQELASGVIAAIRTDTNPERPRARFGRGPRQATLCGQHTTTKPVSPLQARRERNHSSLTSMGCGVLASNVKVPLISRPPSSAVTLYSPKKPWNCARPWRDTLASVCVRHLPLMSFRSAS